MTRSVTAISVFAPAKLNLFLAVTGRRADGFHDLVSVAAPLDYGDVLKVDGNGKEKVPRFSLACDDETVPVDDGNLVLKAASVFAKATAGRWAGGARFSLTKRIPMGAGLGGGSSDAVAALQALNAVTENALAPEAMAAAAAELGSDCALFLRGGAVVMRGRGERTEALPQQAAARLHGRRVLVFKPGFGISTPWAYARMAERPGTYLPGAEAEARLAAWLENEQASAEQLLFNNMEQVAFAKYLALPALLDRLRGDFGLAAHMSGSGSACFVLLSDDAPSGPVVEAIRAAWGEAAFVVEAKLNAPARA